MSDHKFQSLPIAVRVYPDLPGTEKPSRINNAGKRPDAMFIFDTETRTDATQRLTFGSYRLLIAGQCVEENLFFADDLPTADRIVLENYVANHKADAASNGIPELRLLLRKEFLKKFFRDVYKSRALLVGFNLPFDLSRVAFDVIDARGHFEGGFSFGLWSYFDKGGKEQASQYRPRIGIKHIDSKRALKGFTARKRPDEVDLIPEGSPDGAAVDGYKFRGHFLDLRTLAFALTDRSYTLESACEAFGVEHGKHQPSAHGEVTEEYIDYNRRDVLATAELAAKLLEEYDKHPIRLQSTKAFSPASLGKAYLRSTGIPPVLERQPEFPRKYLGYAASAFFGGRTSAHVRKVPVPVVYTDFLSMYPTVNSLMNLWQFVIAREIRVNEKCKHSIQTFLENITADDMFRPDAWKRLTGFIKIIPDGDILPTRAKYSVESNDWQVALNRLLPSTREPNEALWFSLPDAVASKILTGKTPKIIEAFCLEAHGLLPTLKPIKLRNSIEVDPKTQDFFKVVIEQRKQLPRRSDLLPLERKRLDKALKVLANATSYGIYGEMNRQESDNEVPVICYGLDETPFRCRIAHPDAPGEYCFPPFASLITGGARLMLALLEHSLAKLGGTYAMEDTDSMAIVATERGGIVPCPGGSHRTSDGEAGIQALSWKQVQTISERFNSLKPYDPESVPDSILKIEEDNFDLKTRKQRQLYCYAISAKRYDLFLIKNGWPVLLKQGLNNSEDRWSEHGLGHLLNPTESDSSDRAWIAQVWLNILLKAFGKPTSDLAFAHLPAVGRVTVTSPAVMSALQTFNNYKKYADQLKPFNFLLTCHLKQFGHPVGVNPDKFHLIAPYNSDSRSWLSNPWIDQYSGNYYRVTTVGHHGMRDTARVKTYGELIAEYEVHPESKCADVNGETCTKETLGLMYRRNVQIEWIQYIGKESNNLEEVQSGILQSEQNVYTQYPDKRRDEWQTKIVPALREIPLAMLIKHSGLSKRMLIKTRMGRTRPHRSNQELLARVVGSLPISKH